MHISEAITLRFLYPLQSLKRYIQFCMTKTIIIESQQIDFRLIESTDYWCWQGYMPIGGVEMEFEIDSEYHSGEVDWVKVESFLDYVIKNDVIKKYAGIGIEELTRIGHDFFQNSESIHDWKMRFKNSIYFLGVENNNFKYSFLYDFIVKKNDVMDGDPYGLYMVRMENNRMLKAERHQL